MPQSPEVIIAEFEARRATEKKARRTRLWRRGFDLGQIAVSLIVFCALVGRTGNPSNKPYEVLIGIFLFSFLSREVQKRWALEDRVAELERNKVQPTAD